MSLYFRTFRNSKRYEAQPVPNIRFVLKPSSLWLRYRRLKTGKEEESSQRGVVDGLKERVVVDQRVVVDPR